jgi:hypothetical protein
MLKSLLRGLFKIFLLKKHKFHIRRKIIKLIYLDAVGVFLSFANRLFLRQNNPTDAQIQLWDQRIIPVSRVIDPLLGYRTGRSILAIWEKE